MSELIKHISAKEFRSFGYLQELNRQFLHPLGLAIGVNVDDETGEETLGGIRDSREDLEGIIFEPSEFDNEGSQEKYWRVRNEWNLRRAARSRGLGYSIQEVPNIHESSDYTE